ncbi:antitoxin VapB [Rhodothalassium salexigens DSM 2132]|uniref:Antitoxin VapB n=1 Tax=Rhodothalassium salexigens DSM 2132 TaxID=1188247 RepID=A0A4R2P795_RHOSA|nr:type II toxin-antitoxin system VapB family antitoxin [Rhodothalassium salexigens]MBB4212603.1 antitoxin VapB [Rhodothalassium salexigens DSM 2132]MBK1640145.1 AbrB/MazE/SpoVT family DNA-binding domain-containing protein [Rhodothalassium salexigens DSM 2132]TCP30799.1 antitoxin VapB [Rhodothalassium salexigens DSM 2132]
MTRSTVSTTDKTQIVRLPQAVAFPEGIDQVDILKVGHSRLIVPRGRRWDDLFRHGPRATDDYFRDREQL